MSLRCPACGTVFADSASFCTRDGTRLVSVAPAPADAGARAASRAVPPPTPAPGDAPDAPDAPDAAAKAGVPAAAPAQAMDPTPALRPGARDAGPNGRRGRGPAEARELPPHATLTGQVLDGRYLIERKLGEGGMSFVYLAVEMATGGPRAIKVLSPALSRDATAMARLRREADLASRLQHPNVCHIEYLGQTTTGLVYVVMPFVDGEILSDRTYRLGQIPLDEVVGFVREIAAGLQAAHDLQIVHRDLKPENVMITRGRDGHDHAVVMDFGLAKERRAGPELEKLTATGIVLGTPEFMSPEQLRGKPLDGRSDVYSLALMTVEMLTGSLPFAGKSQQELMIARLRIDPTPLRKLRPDLGFSAAVERVLRKALERNPDERYPTAPDLASAFSAAARPGTVGSPAAALKKWFG